MEYLHPCNDNSAINNLDTFFEQIQQNGETIHSFAQDLQVKFDGSCKSGCDVGQTALSMQLGRGVLQGAYGTHPDIAIYQTKLNYWELVLADIKFDRFIKHILGVMNSAGLMVTGAAKRLPTSQIAQRADGGQALMEDAWSSQYSLDDNLIYACFAKTKCPICRHPQITPRITICLNVPR